MTENETGTRMIEAAIALHRELGPGLLETVYEVILARELGDRGLKVERQVPVPIQYKGIRFDAGFRADLIVEAKVIVELKSVEHVSLAHKKQENKRGVPTNPFTRPRTSAGDGGVPGSSAAGNRGAGQRRDSQGANVNAKGNH